MSHAQLNKFNVENCDIRTQMMFESWATIPAYKILTLLLVSKGKGIYSVRNIGVILDIPKSTVHINLNLLITHEYIKLIEGKFYINSYIENVQPVGRASIALDTTVQPVGQDCPVHGTEVSSPLDTNNDKEITIKNNDKENGPPAPEPSKFFKFVKDAFDYDQKHETDNRFINLSQRPLKKYTEIWLTEKKLEDILIEFDDAGIPIDQRNYHHKAFKVVQDKVEHYKQTSKSIKNVSFYAWLTGWAMREVLDTLKSSNDAIRSEKYLERAKQ